MEIKQLPNHCLVCDKPIPAKKEYICVDCVRKEEEEGKSKVKRKKMVYSTSIGGKFHGVKIR